MTRPFKQTMQDLFSGIWLRDTGVAQVYENNADWVDQARAFAKQLAKVNGSVSIDEVLIACPRPTEVHPNATGAVFRENCWMKIGYKQSTISSAHARVIGVFRLKETP